jgi:NAD(P)-dependent dehydrogenase (short-subunit alcohol dehydrogenase family)
MLSYGEGGALVTGGSGGIGSAIVAALARAGVPVGFTYRSGGERAEEIIRAQGAQARIATYPWSSSKATDAAELLKQVEADLGPIRHLVHCAGVSQEAALHTLSEEQWLGIIDTNLTASVALVRQVLFPMVKSGFGRIVLLGSISGLRGIRGHTVYAATKAGLDGLARSLAQECAPFGVTVNSVAPGYIDTPMLDSIPERIRKEIKGRIPVGRLGRPEDVAHVVCFLLSEQAAYVTGQTWVVDGGLSG